MKTSGLRVNDFEILLEVERSLNLTHAAQSLLYSPQHVHQRLRSIERTLGVQLFVREGRGLALTVAGKALLTEAHVVVDGAHRFEQMAQDYRPQKSVVIAASFPDINVLPGLIGRFEESERDIDIHLEVFDIFNVPEVSRRVAAGVIDIGFVATPSVERYDEAVHRLVFTYWRSTPVIVVSATECFDRFMHEMEAHRRIRLFAGAGSPNASRLVTAWMNQGVEVQLTEIGMSMSPSVAIYEAVRQSAYAGQGLALLSQATVEDDLRTGSMRLFPSPVENMARLSYMVTRRGKLPAAVERVLNFLDSVKEGVHSTD